MNIQLPSWLDAHSGVVLSPDPEERMARVLAMARANVARGGGPFAAALFDAQGALIAPGANLVVSAGSSLLHAEVVAIAVAQARLGVYDLSRGPARPYELVASTEPCLMCLGACLWSGIESLVCGARGEDAEAIGFDEGPKPPDWPAELARRGIRLRRDVRRAEAARLLADYRRQGGVLYVPWRGA